MFLVPTRNFQFFSEFARNIKSKYNKIDNCVNRMCFSTLYEKMVYENSVHKKLPSKNVTGPNLCNALHIAIES